VNPTVSIIIPHYNRSRLLKEAVTSVLASRYSAVEVIIVDDGSSNDEFTNASALAGDKVRVIRRDGGKKGPSRCRNVGAAESAGELIIFLDSDDVMAPWCITERLDQRTLLSDADCWVFPVLIFSSTPKDAKYLWNDLDTDDDDALRFARSDPPWHTSSVLWKKSAFLRIGGFDENLLYGDDSDLHLRAVLSGLGVCKFPEALPDVFVRRSSEPRITNSESAELLQSRLERLSAGTRFLRTSPRLAPYLPVWAGQYFMEGEYLLFNMNDPGPMLSRLLDVWKHDAPGPQQWYFLARAYFTAAVTLRDKAYFGVRIGRRIAKVVFPEAFFPRAGGFESAVPGEQTISVVRQMLRSSQ
jgi:glycosyltransferase involved in cell wall biosynthesis